jgi:hypothetical protein
MRMLYSLGVPLALLLLCPAFSAGEFNFTNGRSPYLSMLNTNSMLPALRFDGTFTCEWIKSANVGDIVFYQLDDATRRLFSNYDPKFSKMKFIVHRITQKYVRNGKVYYRTKGDNNAVEDGWEIPERMLVWRVTKIYG